MTIDRMHCTFNMLKREFLDKMWADLEVNVILQSMTGIQPILGSLSALISKLLLKLLSEQLRKSKRSFFLHQRTHLTELKYCSYGHFAVHVCTCKHCTCISISFNCILKELNCIQSILIVLSPYICLFFHRFSSVAKDVFAQKVPSKAYDCYIILCDAEQMLYNTQLQFTGWQNEHIKRLKKLLCPAHAIRGEECYGLEMCNENLEYSVHVAEDIRRHSSMDNYSCELYERAILREKGQKHNAKGLEKTFSTRENMRNVLDDYQEKAVHYRNII